MTTSELVLQTLAGHHEQSVGQLYKKLAGQPGISNSKSVSNALMRLKKDGRVTNTFDADRAIWLWRVVKEGEMATQSECPPDHSEHDLEMASDVAEATVQENLTVETPETFTDTWTTPIGVEFMAAVRLTPMSVGQAMTEYYSCGYEKEDLQAFLAGIEFAEKHHGISQ